MPLDRAKYQRRESSLERFNELKPQRQKREIPQEWKDDLDALNRGEVLEYEAASVEEANALRRTLGRYAASYLKRKLDFSGAGTLVIVRMSDEPYVPRAQRTTGTGEGNGQVTRQRRHRQPEEPVEAEVS